MGPRPGCEHSHGAGGARSESARNVEIRSVQIGSAGARSVDESADPRFGVLDHVVGETVGEVYLPPTPLRLGPLGATVGPNSSIRTLYVNWGLTLAQIQKSCHAKCPVVFLAPCAILPAGA